MTRPHRSPNSIRMQHKGEAEASPFFMLKSWKNLINRGKRRAAHQLERGKLEEYVTYLASPRRVIYSNLLAGMARGLGFGVGVALLGAIVIPLLKRIDFSHVPFQGELARELARLLEARLTR